ncbi:hypothetical protein CTEN210_00174 [Chaetoceros tenuissimus]|uniref:Protein unc-45 homolog B n=1 Tax=Chaetoceros tenuissimus TaxID=426638 RepID=A0AAD3CF84_9STRA|nr:hypothetical protein CTEN210_00174 [Chaetoceros tenuissimus]
MNLSSVEEIKQEGNKLFQKGKLRDAIARYNEAIESMPVPSSNDNEEKATLCMLRSTLISNKGMCQLKLCETAKSIDNLMQLLNTIDELSLALNHLDRLSCPNQDTKPIRSKMLYRRAKARHLLAMNHSVLVTSTTADIPSIVKWMADAQTDLHQLLSFDGKNKIAQKLLLQMKADNLKLKKDGTISTSSSPLESALQNILQLYQKDHSDEKILSALKFIHSCILDDATNAAHELLKEDMKGGVLLIDLVLQESDDDVKALALRCLASACSYPSFTSAVLVFLQENFSQDFELKFIEVIKSTSSKDVIYGIVALETRLILHRHVCEDDYIYANCVEEKQDIDSNDGYGGMMIWEILNLCDEDSIVCALNLLAAWLEPNPIKIIDANKFEDGAKKSYSKVKEPSEEEIQRMVPRALAEYRKCTALRNRNRENRARRNATIFCEKYQGLQLLLQSASTSKDGYLRKEIVLNVARLFNHIRDEAATKGDDDLYIDQKTRKMIENFLSKSEHHLTIEEIGTDDHFETTANDTTNTGSDEIIRCRQRCLFVNSLLIANGEMGSWALREHWRRSRQEWESLVSNNDNISMSIAAEFASAAAGEKDSRPWVSSLVDSSENGMWRRLLSSNDRGVRSGAASAMAKLGLADKELSSDEGEIMGLLEIAAGLLEEDISDNDSNNQTVSKYTAPLERGVELLNYLSTKTLVKDEIAHGFSLKSMNKESESVIERIVDLSDQKLSSSHSVKYAIASIFCSLSVTIETLRKEAFEDKEITAEQYDDLQAMGKTEEERKMEDFRKESDSENALKSRIKAMVKFNVPKALINLLEEATTTTTEQVVTAFTRMACETTVRGAMIQQGCLRSCINLNRVGELSETEKKIVTLAQHTVAKLLVTTNPALLNTAQCMGAIQPLLQMVRNHESSDLQKFEALLSITNLASLNEGTKQHIIAEKGIPILTYAMFSNHEMVRRAATEAVSNLFPHPKMIEHFQNEENLKVLVAFAADFNENFECARAAAGCIAMLSQDLKVAQTLVKVKNTGLMIKEVIESGQLDLMHRILVAVVDMMAHGEEFKQFVISIGVVAFCDAYVIQYENGNGLEFSESDRQSLHVTIELAKEVVKNAY